MSLFRKRKRQRIFLLSPLLCPRLINSSATSTTSSDLRPPLESCLPATTGGRSRRLNLWRLRLRRNMRQITMIQASLGLTSILKVYQYLVLKILRIYLFSATSCVADGGPAAGKMCNFPFKHQGKTYYECAPLEG